MKRTTLVTAAVVLFALSACEDNSTTPQRPPSSDYQQLTTRSAVLNNIEVAYNRRHINKYQEVLDGNFTFYFASSDVGGDVPEQWGRQEEIDANRNMFDPNWQDPDNIQPAVKKIFMDVKWEDGLQWQKLSADNGEEWFAATVFYNFQIDIGQEDHFVNDNGAKAKFTVRNAGTEEAPHWQLVEMEDFGSGGLSATSLASTDQGTWGEMKANYR